MAQTGCAAPKNPKIALVLAGGAARGAYEAGVVQHVLEEVSDEIGRDVPIDILCGTSAGAINACFLAAFSDQPRARAARLVREWTTLDLSGVVQTEQRVPLELIKMMLGRRPPSARVGRGGLLNPSGIERVVRRAIPFERIGPNVNAGHLQAVTVSTTHVTTGRTVVFVEKQGTPSLSRGRDPTMTMRHTTLGPPHAMASAAIPLLFPAVPIAGQFYCDGGLRQNVPLSPARRLGADGLIVISPRSLPEEPPVGSTAQDPTAPDQAETFPGPLFLLGKALNALLLDRIEADIDRLQRINQILEAGCRRFGPRFIEEINQELYGESAVTMRPIRSVLIRASQDIGRLAAEFVRRPGFLARPRRALVGRVLRRLAEGEGRRQADFLSYLLFDGEFCGQLIELGRADARARHDELCQLFSSFSTEAR